MLNESVHVANGQIARNKDLSHFDKGQIVVARRLSEHL